MKFLHTSDWHVGKTLKGRDRLDEQRGVLAEIAQIAEENQVDAVLVAGDVYESWAPSAPAQQLVIQTLLRLRQAGAEVIVIAGNHDHGPTFEAYRPLMNVAGITLVGMVRPPGQGGVVRFRARSGGEDVQVAVLPFLTQRYAVRAAEIVTQTPSENVRAYDEMVRQIVAALTGRVQRRHRQPADVAPHLHRRRVRRRASGPPSRSSSTASRRASSRSRRTTSPWATCTGGSRCPRTARCTTAARRSPSTSASRTTPASCAWSRRARPPRPASPTSRSPRAAGCGRSAGPCPSWKRRAASFGEDYLRVWLREPTRAGLRDDTDRGPAERHRGADRPGIRRAVPLRPPRHGQRAADPGPAVRRVLRLGPGAGRPGGGAVRATARRDHRRRPRGLSREKECRHATDRAGHERVRFLPGADPGRLHRCGLLRARRPHRIRQVDRHRRDDVRALRVGSALGPEGNGLPRARADHGPGDRQARLRNRGPALRRGPRTAPGQAARSASGPRAWSGWPTRHGLAEPGEPTEVLAKDLSGVTDAVERLLGLSYEDFCQCVVLPQGQFANFLHAKSSERQEILLRLLGAEHYRQMMMRANQQASAAAQRAGALAETLLAFADATPEARTRPGPLRRPWPASASGWRRPGRRSRPRTPNSRPPGAELARLEGRADGAGRGACPRRRRCPGRGPGRQPLGPGAGPRPPRSWPRTPTGWPGRRWRTAPSEHRWSWPASGAPSAASTWRGFPRCEAEVTPAVRAVRAGRETVHDASSRAWRNCAHSETRRARGAEAADRRVADLSAEHAALVAVTVPDGTGQLDERRRAAADAAREASAALRAGRAGRQRGPGRPQFRGPQPGPLEQALRDLRDLADLIASLAPARARLHQARDQRAAADTALEAAEAARTAASAGR